MARCAGRRAVDRGMVKLQVLAFMLVMAYMMLVMAYMMLVAYVLLMAYMMLMTLKASAVKGVRCIC